MQQVESVSQNNTVSAVFVQIHACVCLPVGAHVHMQIWAR